MVKTKIISSSAVILLLLSSNTMVSASAWESTKEYGNKAMFWKNKHLEDVDFKHVYPKEFYKKSYFGFVITSTVVIVGGAVSYFTAGVGAPAAATGVSSVASFVGGGGAGSYMAGLSTIGTLFGGNAMLGSAILNGISYGVIGGGVGALSAVGKVGVMASVTAIGLDGVAYFSHPETKNLEYKVKVSIPKNLGSKDTRQLVDNIYDTEEKIYEALENDDKDKQKAFFELKSEYNKNAIELLKQQLHKEDNQEDLIVLGIIAWNNSEYKLFDEAISKIDVSKLKNTGFLNYLYALQSLSRGDTEKTFAYLDNSKDENKYVLEPVILYINVLGNKDFIRNESKIESLVKHAEENFDSDKYSTEYSLVGVYYRTATFYFNNKRYAKAEEYYKKAEDKLGLMQKHFFGKELKHIIRVGVANSLYMQNKTASSDEVYDDIIKDIDENNIDEKNKITEQYLGSKK